MLDRSHWTAKIDKLFEVHRIVALIGPRQCGKTTLAKQYASKQGNIHFFDLENPQSLERLKEPISTLEPLDGTIVIDEVQLLPDLFPTLRFIHDEYPNKRFLLLGSASRDLIEKASETLAGRIAYIELLPFMMNEVNDMHTLWTRGGYPKSFLQNSDENSFQWRTAYIRSYLERDLNMLGIKVSPETLRQFWTMLTHYHGQIFNSNEISQSLGISHPTAKHYLDILHQTFMIRVLRPYHANIKKRQVKNHKIYWRDSGIFHNFLNIKSYTDIMLHPKAGASFEGFAMEQIIHMMDVDEHDCYFWGAHSYGEIDLLVSKNAKLYGFEFKLSDAPKASRVATEMVDILPLEHLYVVYPGKETYPISKNVTALGLGAVNQINFLYS